MTQRPMLATDQSAADSGAPPPGQAQAAVREVNATGWGALGRLTITHDITPFTRARVFARIGRTTDMLARFSTAAGEAERDVRGFALKFYTEEGNWDLVGNNTPVFYVRDPAKFPDYIRTQKRLPDTNKRSAAAMWDFWSRNPESLHQVTILMSDRGLPASPRFMDGFGSHTYSFYNEAGARFWVKFHFKSLQGHSCRGGEAVDYQHDLSGAIARGEFPQWRLCVQIMPEAEAAAAPFDPFDVTKVWPHAAYPLHDVGIMELNRNPADYFAAIEQAAFSPSNVVPGIGVSPDRMLQARIFSYADAHRHRLGAHYAALPVNAPKVSMPHGHAAATPLAPPGHGRHKPAFPNLVIQPTAPARTPRAGNDDYSQVAALFRLFDAGQRQCLFANIAASLKGVAEDIVARQLGHFRQVDPAYADGVAAALGRRAARAAE